MCLLSSSAPYWTKISSRSFKLGRCKSHSVILSAHLIPFIYILSPQAAVMTQFPHSEPLQHRSSLICSHHSPPLGWTVCADCPFTHNTPRLSIQYMICTVLHFHESVMHAGAINMFCPTQHVTFRSMASDFWTLKFLAEKE